MASRASVLILARGQRVHRIFREMAADLVQDHHVTVLAMPEEHESFAAVPGVRVRSYQTPDMLFGSTRAHVDMPQDVYGTVSRIEQALGLSLYKAATNYLLFARLIRESGGRYDYLTTEQELLAAYVGAYRDLSAVVDETAPDVVFFEGIDVISSYVMLALAYKAGVFALEPRFSLLGQGDISLTYGIGRRNIVMERLYECRDLITQESYSEADRILADLESRFQASTYAAVNRRMMQARSPLNFRRVASRLVDPHAAWQTIRDARRLTVAARNRVYLERRLARALPDHPYIAMPLQHVPEAGICSQCPLWIRQDSVVEQLALNAPARLRIVIKEHPRTFGSRGAAFFGPLMDMPNVVVCHPDVDTFSMLSRAEAVVSITGTPGFEATLLGKRVGILGTPFYSVYRGARLLKYPGDIYPAMDDPSWRPEEMHTERRDFLAAYVQSLHPFGQGQTRFYPDSGGERWAAALRRTMEFVATHGLTPRNFGTGLTS